MAMDTFKWSWMSTMALENKKEGEKKEERRWAEEREVGPEAVSPRSRFASESGSAAMNYVLFIDIGVPKRNSSYSRSGLFQGRKVTR